jgi:PI31 proteasome regulator N-terminal
MEDWEKEFDAVRQFILRSPMSSEHPAIVAALSGIDQEVKRRHRDSKLYQKFSNVSSTATNSSHTVIGDVEMDAVKVEAPLSETKQPELKPPLDDDTNMSMADDWQDVVGEEDMTSDTNADGEAGALGTEMAKNVVFMLAAHQVACASPTAALAVAVHAVLLQCDFICTGVPEIAPPVGGFAAPIRDLPVGQFLPPNWEVPLNGIQFRYRNRKVSGSYVLSVSTTSSSGQEESNGSTLQVSLSGSSSFSSLDSFHVFISDHINLNSWTMAQQKSNGKISPVLHYKALAPLLAKFMQNFHLKSKLEEKEKDGAVQSIESHLETRYLNDLDGLPGSTRPWVPNPPVESDLSNRMLPAVAKSMRSSMDTPRQGAFDGDLNPLGGLYPQDGTLFPGGNLMGPNHPMFTGGGAHPLGPPSGMQPRFDPFGPPGGPTEPVPSPFQVDPPGKAPGFPTGGTGNPNNDLAIPPPFGGNNLFL